MIGKLKNAKFIKNRLGEVCEIYKDECLIRYTRNGTPLQKLTEVFFDSHTGRFIPNTSSKSPYDIIEILTKENNPELFL